MNLIFPFDILQTQHFVSNELDIFIVTCNLSISFQMNLIFPFDIFVLHGMPYVCVCVHCVSEPMQIASIPLKNTLATLQLVWFNTKLHGPMRSDEDSDYSYCTMNH